MNDSVNHPSYYKGWSNGAEVIDITENLNFNRGNAVKYIARAGRKNPDAELEDLYKAQWYINRELQRLCLANPDTRKPLTFDRIKDVPKGMIVKDSEGDQWGRGAVSGSLFYQYGGSDEWYLASDTSEHIDADFAPYEEVL